MGHKERVITVFQSEKHLLIYVIFQLHRYKNKWLSSYSYIKTYIYIDVKDKLSSAAAIWLVVKSGYEQNNHI